jgi:hypothetical protein
MSNIVACSVVWRRHPRGSSHGFVRLDGGLEIADGLALTWSEIGSGPHPQGAVQPSSSTCRYETPFGATGV